MVQMFVCATCGNKRCPHATDHRLACTGSNDLEQEGSNYGPQFTQDWRVASAAQPKGGSDDFERGRQQGMRQERALWELAASAQEIEAPQGGSDALTDEQIPTLWGAFKRGFFGRDKEADALIARLDDVIASIKSTRAR